MTYRIKVPPRTLPVGEEQLVSGLEHWLIGLKSYRWSVIVGFVLLLLMGMGLWGLFWYEEQNASKAQELEREATLRLFTRTSNDPQKTATNLNEAIALYKRVLDEYPRTPTAPLVQFSLGNAYLQSNNVDSAIDAYQRFTSTYTSNTSLLGLVYQKLGYAYLLKKDLDQAAKAYSSILDMPGAMNRDGLITDWFLFAPDCLRIAPPLSVAEETLQQICTTILQSVSEAIPGRNPG